MTFSFKTINDVVSLKEKTVLVRIDSDVTVKDGEITDDTRLKGALETINYLIAQKAKIVLLGHLGRPDGVVNKEFTLLPVAEYFSKHFQGSIKEEKFGDFSGWEITPYLSLLENLRFYKGEEENDKDFAHNLAVLGDIYVNESFATSHRAHASIVGIPEFIPSFAGFHLEKEIEVLTKVMSDPERPLVVIIGGAKLETKLPMVEKMRTVADYVLVGGKIAQEKEKLGADSSQGAHIVTATLNSEEKDITPDGAKEFCEIIQKAGTVVWNGPMGLVEEASFQEGTRTIAQAIIDSHAYSVIGGGDTISFLDSIHVTQDFKFVSLGGGAMLSFLSGEELVGIVALVKNASRG